MSSRSIEQLRKLGIWEGSSLLLLLLVAMPIKYLLGEPMPVRVIGMAHGLLFMAYVFLVWHVGRRMQWSWTTLGLLFIGSCLPFGTFAADSFLRRESRKSGV